MLYILQFLLQQQQAVRMRTLFSFFAVRSKGKPEAVRRAVSRSVSRLQDRNLVERLSLVVGKRRQARIAENIPLAIAGEESKGVTQTRDSNHSLK